MIILVIDDPQWPAVVPRNARGDGRLAFESLGAFGPYPDGLQAAQGRSGVYVIRDRGKVAYVGRAEDDVYKAATRHFQRWARSPRARRSRPATAHDPGITYDRATSAIAVIPTAPDRAYVRQRELIDALSPRDNIHHNPGGG